MRHRLIYVLLFSILLVSFVPVAYANEDSISLENFPQQLADALGIGLYAGQLLAASIFLCIFCFPACMLAGRDNAVFALLIVGLPVLAFCIAMGWLAAWILLIVALVVALMFSGKAREWISGGRD